MSPEQMAEHRRRAERKALTLNIACQALSSLIHEHPELSAADLAKRAWDIGEAMAAARTDRGHDD